MKAIKSLFVSLVLSLSITVTVGNVLPPTPTVIVYPETDPETVSPADDGSGNTGGDESY